MPKSNWKFYIKLAVVTLFPILGAVGNRQRGKNTEDRFMKLPKLVWYFIFGLADFILIYTPAYAFFVEYLGWNAYITMGSILINNFILYLVGFSPSWGELFPHLEKDTSGEEYAAGVKEITDKVMGYENSPRLWSDYETGKQVGAENNEYVANLILNWKTMGMSVRWMLYFAPQTISYCILTLSPVFLLRFGALYAVGPIYRHFHNVQRKKGGPARYDATAAAEPWVGALLKLTDGLLLSGAMFLTFAS